VVRENTDRNFLVYELWKKGRTIDEIAFETAIPTIVLQQVREQPDEKAMAALAFVKSSAFGGLLEMLKNGEIDKVYKMLMILKLTKELWRYIFPTKEEREAFFKNLGYVIEQISLANKSKSG